MFNKTFYDKKSIPNAINDYLNIAEDKLNKFTDDDILDNICNNYKNKYLKYKSKYLFLF